MRLRLRAASVLLTAAVAAASVAEDARGAQRGDPTPSQPPIDKDSPPGKGMPPPQRLGFESFKAWMTAVEQHVPGAIDAPLQEIARRSRAEIDHAVIHFQALVLLIRDPKAIIVFQRTQGPEKRTAVEYFPRDVNLLQDLAAEVGRRVSDSIDDQADDEASDALVRRRQQAADALVRRAAWLHTDLAILAGGEESRLDRRASASSEAVLVQWTDGRQLTALEATGHLDFARTILTYGRRVPAMSSAVALWYRATAAHLQRKRHTDRPHLDAAVRQFPRDAHLLFYAGASHEMAALPLVQEVLDDLRLPYGAAIDIRSPRSELQQAERLLRRATVADRELTEARIRLGNVLGLLGRHTDAVRELERAVPETSGDTLLAFYARMFLGREAEALGDFQKARASYEQAARLYPRAQSPLVGLSAVAKREGSDDLARTTIDRLLARSWATDDDPWWRYAEEAGRSADALITAARKTFTARRRP